MRCSAFSSWPKPTLTGRVCAKSNTGYNIVLYLA